MVRLLAVNVQVAEELDGKPTTMDDVGPYYILGELGRLERRYTQQAAKTPGQLNLNHTLFGKNQVNQHGLPTDQQLSDVLRILCCKMQVAALTELLIRHPEIQRLELMNNALDDAMAALVIEVVSSGVTSIDTLLLNDNLLTWMSCDRMGPLLKRRPVSPGSPLHPKPLATLQVLPALPRLFFRTMRSCARPR